MHRPRWLLLGLILFASCERPGEGTADRTLAAEALRLNGWQVRTDQLMADGSIALYADSGRRPLWITLRATVGAPGTTYTLVGAILGADTTKAQRSGSSMSSNRIQRR